MINKCFLKEKYKENRKRPNRIQQNSRPRKTCIFMQPNWRMFPFWEHEIEKSISSTNICFSEFFHLGMIK